VFSDLERALGQPDVQCAGDGRAAGDDLHGQAVDLEHKRHAERGARVGGIRVAIGAVLTLKFRRMASLPQTPVSGGIERQGRSIFGAALHAIRRALPTTSWGSHSYRTSYR
jgi:hypothetical protein